MGNISTYRDKIQSLEALEKAVATWKSRGESVVLANGCFDILHVGHVRYLQGAKAAGDRLVVGINSDKSTRRLKGEGRPILPESARAELVAAVAVVDAVTVFDEPSVETLLRRLLPAIHAKGTDYTADSVPEAAIARSLGVKICIVGDAKEHSTRELLARIAADRPKPA